MGGSVAVEKVGDKLFTHPRLGKGLSSDPSGLERGYIFKVEAK
jgi:hypothetical protein